MVTHKEKSRTICSTCSKGFKNKRYLHLDIQKSECEVTDDVFIVSMMDYPTLVGNSIVTNESNFGNVEKFLAVANPKVDTENNFQFLTICTIAASSNSSDIVWFIRVKEPYIAVADQNYIIENFVEKSRSNSKGHYFKVGIKTSYFYHESIVYPFAHFAEKKNEFFMENSEYFEIINFVGHMGMASLFSL